LFCVTVANAIAVIFQLATIACDLEHIAAGAAVDSLVFLRNRTPATLELRHWLATVQLLFKRIHHISVGAESGNTAPAEVLPERLLRTNLK